MASVRKRKWVHEGVEKEAWVVNYTDQSGKRRLKTFDKKKDADAHRTKIEGELQRGTHVPSKLAKSFIEVADDWLKECERRASATGSPAKSTLKSFRWCIDDHLAPTFGKRPIAEIEADEFQDLLSEKKEILAWATMRHVHLVMSKVMQFAVKNGQIHRNVIREGEVRIPGHRKKIVIPSRADITQLLEALTQRARGEQLLTFMQRRVFVALALFCGMRVGEICGLQWECVDFETNRIAIRHSYSAVNGFRRPKTEAGDRNVSMPPIVRAALIELADYIDKPGCGFVVTTKSGENLRSGYDNIIWRPLMKKAGLCHPPNPGRRYGRAKFHFHALRHASVSLLIAQGLNGHQIAPFIGHAKVSTTLDIYGHLFPEDDHVGEVMARVSDGALIGWEAPKPVERK